MTEPAWVAEMRKQAEYDRDNGRLNTLVENHCLLDVLDQLLAASALPGEPWQPPSQAFDTWWIREGREMAENCEKVRNIAERAYMAALAPPVPAGDPGPKEGQ